VWSKFYFERGGPYTDVSELTPLQYVASVSFDVVADAMPGIISILAAQNVLYHRVKELSFGEDALIANRQLFEIARFFPRLLCIHSYSEDPQIQQMGAEVFGTLWHPQ
jgi:hypothetical protein